MRETFRPNLRTSYPRSLTDLGNYMVLLLFTTFGRGHKPCLANLVNRRSCTTDRGRQHRGLFTERPRARTLSQESYNRSTDRSFSPTENYYDCGCYDHWPVHVMVPRPLHPVSSRSILGPLATAQRPSPVTGILRRARCSCCKGV